MASHTPSILRSSTGSSSARRPLILIIALLSLAFHLYLASRLSRVSRALADTIAAEEDDGGGPQGGDWKRLELVKLAVGMARLSSWLSAAVAGVGFWGTIREHLPFLRLFTLNSFISLGLELVLLTLISLTAFSSSSTLSSSVCGAISNADLGSYFGYSLESCEERFGSLLLTALGFVAAITLLRAWGSLKTLEYYEAVAKRQRRKLPSLSINPHASPSRYRDSDDPSAHYSAITPSSKRSAGPSQRILLLPDPHSRAKEANNGGNDVPMLSLTASSPARTSFPPPPHASTSATGREDGEDPKYLVYAPVMMTAEEARLVGAREIHISSSSHSHHSHRPRSRSNAKSSSSAGGAPSSSSATPATPSEESLVTPIAEERDSEERAQREMVVGGPSNGKGKLA